MGERRLHTPRILGALLVMSACSTLGCSNARAPADANVAEVTTVGETPRELSEDERFAECKRLEQAKDWRNASECFTRFARDFQGSRRVDEALLSAWRASDEWNRANEDIRARYEMLKSRGNSEVPPEKLLDLAQSYERLAIFSRAAKFYELFAKNFPEHEQAPEALERAAQFREGLGEYARAVYLNEKYIELFQASHPDDARLATERVAALKAKMAGPAPTVVPGEAASDTVAAHATPAPDISEEELAQIIAENKHDPGAHHALACIHREKRAYNDAIKHARKSLAGDPDHTRGFEVLAMVYRDMGYSSIAELTLERGEEAGGEHAALANARGILAFDRGDLAKAKAHFARALELDGTFEPAQRNADIIAMSESRKEGP